MIIKGTTPVSAEKVDRTIATVEILTGVKLQGKKKGDVSIEDTFDSAPEIEHYRNYSKSGLLNDSVSVHPQKTNFTETIAALGNELVENSDIKPDIDVSNLHNWRDPRIQEKVDIINDLFGRRAAESNRTSDPMRHAWRRYFDPSAPHFVGHDLDEWERRDACSYERSMIRAQQRGYGGPGSITLLNPIFEGRGLGRSDPTVPRMEPLNVDREQATRVLLMRHTVNRQLSELFERNGIVIPENVRLSFTIDFFHRLRVTGTDDEDLIMQIEEVLNMNGNSSRLWGHIYTSITHGHYINTNEPLTGQLSASGERFFWLDSMLMNYTGHSLRHDLELVDGKFLTKNGEDILELAANVGNRYVAAYLVQELSWLASAGGLENIPNLTLAIDFENGHLYDVGQRYGFGPGQTGWITKLPGTMHDESLVT